MFKLRKWTYSMWKFLVTYYYVTKIKRVFECYDAYLRRKNECSCERSRWPAGTFVTTPHAGFNDRPRTAPLWVDSPTDRAVVTYIGGVSTVKVKGCLPHAVLFPCLMRLDSHLWVSRGVELLFHSQSYEWTGKFNNSSNFLYFTKYNYWKINHSLFNTCYCYYYYYLPIIDPSVDTHRLSFLSPVYEEKNKYIEIFFC